MVSSVMIVIYKQLENVQSNICAVEECMHLYQCYRSINTIHYYPYRACLINLQFIVQQVPPELCCLSLWPQSL